MMGYYYDTMMGGWGASWSIFRSLVHLELVIIGALIIVWLWKKVR